MNLDNYSRRFLILFCFLITWSAWAVTFTSNTNIAYYNTNFDGEPIVITNCTVTVDGAHVFCNVDVQNGGVLTCSATPSGVLTNGIMGVTNEQHVFSSSNPAMLNNSNVLYYTVVVTDLTGTNIYMPGTDYFAESYNGGTVIAYVAGTTIPDGSDILVSYEYSVLVQAGVNLTAVTNFEVEVGGIIDVDEAGYGPALGPGPGTSLFNSSPYPHNAGSGGAFGGSGGTSDSGALGGLGYGVISNATIVSQGSGGGAGSGPGGAGGGAINLVVGGLLRVDGKITANGANGTNLASGGGAGGGIELSASTISGAGTISAQGGGGDLYSGGGGGGRLVILYGTDQFTGTLAAQGGVGAVYGGAGTIYLKAATNPVAQVTIVNGGVLGAFTPWNNAGVDDLTVSNGAKLDLLQQSHTVNNLVIGPNGLLTLSSNFLEELPNLVVNSNADIQTGGAIVLDGLGYTGGTGIGPGQSASVNGNVTGGGGAGGSGSQGGPSLYGAAGGSDHQSITEPNAPGSGGGAGFAGPGGAGGAFLSVLVGGILQIEGSITANGGASPVGGSGGGGGGAISLTAQTLTGAGTISANGGAGDSLLGGGGGGGSIVISFALNAFTGVISAYGGSGANFGGPGIIYEPSAGELIVDNNGASGPPTPVATTANVTVSGGATVSLAPLGAIGGLIIQSNSSVVTGGGFTVYGNATIAAGCSLVVASGTEGLASRILVEGTLTLDGTLAANGSAGLTAGANGGNGGVIFLTAVDMAGSGLLSANGGAGAPPSGNGGNGGTITVYRYFPTNHFPGRVTAYGGGGVVPGGAGTVYLDSRDTNVAELILDNGGETANFATLLTNRATYNLTITGGAKGLISAESYGAALNLDNLLIASNSWLVVSNGLLPTMNASNATIQAGGGITLNGYGYLGGQGTGAGNTLTGLFGTAGGGGGYGGNGGAGGSNVVQGIALGGTAYGLISASPSFGSGGGGYQGAGGSGGGVLELTVSRTLDLDGVISANGNPGLAQNSGGGSGGGIQMTVGQLAGSGLVSANGGAGYFPLGGGGSGGRIMISVGTNLFAGGMTAYGGTGANAGGAGTVYVGPGAQEAGPTQIVVDNGGINGSNTPLPRLNSLSSLTISGGARAVGSGGTIGTLLINSNGWLGPNASLQLPESFAFTVSINATILAGGGIVADATGNPGGDGTGTGAGSIVGAGGGGFGGYGGNGSSGALGGSAYGQSSVIQTFPAYGSGGGLSDASGSGGAGGGAVQLIVNGALLLKGLISANGGPAPLDNGGGGSGGYISLQAQSLSGNGLIAANGGAGDSIFGGGGGGGRIVIDCASNSFTGAATAHGGAGANFGGAGTVFITSNLNALGQFVVDNGGFTGADTPVSQFSGNPAPPFGLTVSGGAIAFPSPGLVLSNLTVKSGAKIIGGIDLSNVSNPGYTVTLTVIGNTLVDSDSAISVDNQGYNGGSGPGAGQDIADGYGGGGGYGGAGGASSTGSPGGVTYGSASQPTNWGSGGGFSPGAPNFCQGGGAIQLMIGGDLTLNGALSADGNQALFGGGGGGAGGSVWVTSRELDGNGSVRANGGAGYPGLGGGGGGGRIAVNTLTDNFTGLLAALGGPGYLPGRNGTVVTSTIPPPQVISQSPTGAVSYAVSNVLLTFGSPMSLGLVTGANITVDTPNGPLPSGSPAVAPSGLYSLQVSFTPQNTIGYYDVQAGPQIQDIYGQTPSPAKVGSWVILPLIIYGQVTSTDGQPVPYVTLHPTGGLDPVLTDTNGDYSLEVPPSWTGTITPSKGESIFLPASRSYAGVSRDMSDQSFVITTPAAMTLSASYNGSTMNLRHYAISGVIYQILYSTNTVNWQPYTTPYEGTNGWMGITVLVSGAPAVFYKFSASY